MKLKDLQVERLRLEADFTLPPQPGYERYIHPLVGNGRIVTEEADYEIRGRSSVFAPPGAGVLFRDDKPVLIVPVGPLDLLVASVPSTARQTAPEMVTPKTHEIGEGNAKRIVYEILGGDGPSQRLRCGETVNQRGGWSSWPPHSFDYDLTRYAEFEEVFVPFMRPRDGYAILRLDGMYHDGVSVNGSSVLRSGEMIQVPLGKHPIVGSPETELMYVWFYISPSPKVYSRWAEDVGQYQ